jgi:hypothetical protein
VVRFLPCLVVLLIAKPPKGGDAELRDYSEFFAKSAEPPAIQL